MTLDWLGAAVATVRKTLTDAAAAARARGLPFLTAGSLAVLRSALFARGILVLVILAAIFWTIGCVVAALVDQYL